MARGFCPECAAEIAEGYGARTCPQCGRSFEFFGEPSPERGTPTSVGALTDADRRRIYEEEKARVEARERIKREHETQEAAATVKKVTPWAGGFLVLVIILAVVGFVRFMAGSDQPSRPGPGQVLAPSHRSPAQVLAWAHLGMHPSGERLSTAPRSYPSAGQPVTTRFETLLESIARKAPGHEKDREGLADMLLKGWQKMWEQGGVQGDLLEFVDGVDRSFTEEHVRIGLVKSVSEVIALYALETMGNAKRGTRQPPLGRTHARLVLAADSLVDRARDVEDAAHSLGLGRLLDAGFVPQIRKAAENAKKISATGVEWGLLRGATAADELAAGSRLSEQLTSEFPAVAERFRRYAAAAEELAAALRDRAREVSAEPGD